MLTAISKFEYPLMQRKTQNKLSIQIRKKRKLDRDDKPKMMELLRESVENQNWNYETMIEATKELKNGRTEQASIMMSGFKDVVKFLLELKK